MTRARALHLLALAAVTGLALALRLLGLDWDQGHHLHPDERFLSIVLTQIRPADRSGDVFRSRHIAVQPVQPGH